jgi:hypothetical protein
VKDFKRQTNKKPKDSLCDSCGSPASHWRENRDECPTDRGVEVRWYTESLCDDCYKEQGFPRRSA